MDSWIEGPPTVKGWYAISFCWDAREGIFVDAAWWDGKDWNVVRPNLQRSAHTFETRAEARDWADEHDPEAR